MTQVISVKNLKAAFKQVLQSDNDLKDYIKQVLLKDIQNLNPTQNEIDQY